ncbi:MAG: ABC transporter ATP-binding protein [Muribaculum sp.]|nr:ABC transporter ATP-binding protein [Muribaculum sp.]
MSDLFQTGSVVKITSLKKKYKGFELSIPDLQIPKGFATALIGENGAGKTTLLNILAGIRLDYKGDVAYFDEQEKICAEVQERLGYVGTGSYFLPQWTAKQVAETSRLLFEHFHEEEFWKNCDELNIPVEATKNIRKLSAGNCMKLKMALVMARDTEFLVLDEPASPLDPLMRDKLCDMIRGYLEKGDGGKSVFFSTHNISDMENVTDYAIIMEHGSIVEAGFVEELKEKYILVKGEAADADAAAKALFSITKGNYGFEGICLAENLDQLAGMDISRETPTLYQISVAVMKANTKLKFT